MKPEKRHRVQDRRKKAIWTRPMTFPGRRLIVRTAPTLASLTPACASPCEGDVGTRCRRGTPLEEANRHLSTPPSPDDRGQPAAANDRGPLPHHRRTPAQGQVSNRTAARSPSVGLQSFARPRAATIAASSDGNVPLHHSEHVPPRPDDGSTSSRRRSVSAWTVSERVVASPTEPPIDGRLRPNRRRKWTEQGRGQAVSRHSDGHDSPWASWPSTVLSR
jgi:hypothetical protein